MPLFFVGFWDNICGIWWKPIDESPKYGMIDVCAQGCVFFLKRGEAFHLLINNLGGTQNGKMGLYV